ncbi:MAG: DUF1926 domain-containing protein [Chloroflexi bacterium]|nr:DUF1926 domain-containing protein [Chloroflexota bacterium]
MSTTSAPRRISLALTLHNHQPVGNFGWVFDEIYEKAYLPMIEALERHPTVRLSLHYTGPLLEWFAAAHPEFLQRVRALVEREQVEIVGGGLYEPILASLPTTDRIAQLRRMRSRIKEFVGVAPEGAWLAERVWEPSLPAALHDGGYRWTILDDAHFRAAAIPEDALWGAYLTEDEGKPLTVFGTEQGLRYRIPFGTVESIIEYLREHATTEGDRIGTMGDDGEKFGSWPTTWDHCWGEGQWVEKFFTALEQNATWLTTTTPSRWLDERGPIGRVYIPTSSYAEMGDWVLPPNESQIFGPMLHAAQDAGRPEARYLRGGFWRNFQVKYTEINDLHKQMLRTSAKVAEMPNGAAKVAAEDHLHRGQSNDCYWHGLFGGVYITHMRLATFEHLIAAEDIADGTYRRSGNSQSLPALVSDLDLDGAPEIQIANAGARLQIDPAEGGAITAIDLRAPHHALLAVLRRRPEAYHEKLRAHAAIEAAGGSAPAAAEEGAVASIHDIVAVKEPGLAAKLIYDDHERRSALLRLYPAGTDGRAIAAGTATASGSFLHCAWGVSIYDDQQVTLIANATVGTTSLSATRTIRLTGGRMDPIITVETTLAHLGGPSLSTVLDEEWNLMLLGGGGNPAAHWTVAGVRTAHDRSGEAPAGAPLHSGNDYLGIALSTTTEPHASAAWSPIETISNSEGGFERVYQGSSLHLLHNLELTPNGSFTVRTQFAATLSRDMTAEEGLSA